MKPKLIIHVGFHKTGTKTIQERLKQMRKGYDGTVHIILQGDPELRSVERASRVFDRWPNRFSLFLVQRAWKKILSNLSQLQKESVIISSENLIGLIPSNRDRHPIYHNASQLMSTLSMEIYDWDVNLLIYLRNGNAWLDSLHRHLIFTRGITTGFLQFSTMSKFAHPDIALTNAADRIEAALNYSIIRVNFDNEAKSDLGLGAKILECSGLSALEIQNIKKVDPKNVGITRDQAEKFQAIQFQFLPRPLRRFISRYRCGVK